MPSQPASSLEMAGRGFRLRRMGACMGVVVAMATGVRAQFSYTEDFTNSTAAGWNFFTGDQGPGIRLTSGATPTSGDPEFGNSSIDASGQGWMRLTSGVENQANAAYFDTPIPSAGNRVSITFNANLWGGNNYNGYGADGLVFFLYDASASFNPGAFGGSLGYAQKDGIDGLGGGYMGVALDVFGNFSNPTEGRDGGVGYVPNAVVVRGPGEGETGYDYLAGTSGSSGPAGRDYTDSGDPTTLDAGDATVGALPYLLGSPLATERPNQSTQYRKVEVTLDENSQLIVRMQFGEDGLWYDVLNLDYSSFVRPEQLRIGFSAGTGGGTMIYEVGGLLRIDATAGSGNFLWDNDEGPANQIWGTSATNPLNWFGNTNPTLKANIIFNSAYIDQAQNIDLRGSDKVVKNIYFSGPNAYSLFTSENRRLIFDSDTVGGLTTISLTGDVAGDVSHSVGVDILMNKTLDVNNNIAPVFTISGDIDTNGNALNLKGTGTTAISGDISGTGALTKSGPGTARLTGANTYTGATTIEAGTLEAGSANALGATTAGTTVQSGGTLALTGSTTFAAESLSIAGTGASGTGALRNLSGNNTWTGTVALADDATVTAETGTTLTVSGVVSGAAANDLTKTGAGTLVLSGVNTYTGRTLVNGGTVAISNENNLGANPGSFNAGQLTLDGGTLRSQTNAVIIDDANRGVTIGAAGGTFDTTTNLTVATVVTGSGSLTKTGSANLTLSGTNTHSGAVNIDAGTLTATGGSAIGNNSAVAVASGATFNTSASSETIGSLAGAGSTNLGSTTLTTGGNNNSTTYSGVISGTGGSLTKTGTGNLTLSGANTYTGSTTINAGRVTLGASNVLANSSTVVLNGGTLALGGNFSDTIGSLSLTASSTIDFANATGTLTFTNASRTGGNLTIDNWAGEAFGGGNSQLVFTNGPAGFTFSGGRYTEIQFTDWGSGAIRLANGEIVPYTGGTVYTYAVNAAGNWDVDTNWLDGTGSNPASDPGTFAQNIGDTAILGSAITANRTVTLTNNRTLGYLIANDDNTYTITNNTLTFDVASGRAQIVNQNSGGLVINSSVALNDNLTLTQAGAGTVDINGNITGTNRDILVTGAGVGDVRFDGAVTTGTGSLTKTGASTLTLSGVNTFTGAITVTGGVLAINAQENLGSLSASADLTLNGGTLRVTSGTVDVDDNTRNLVLGADGGTLDAIGDLIWDNGISGGGSLTKTGAGSLTIEDPTTFTGAFNINAGSVIFAGGDNRLADVVAVTIASGATLNINNYSDTIGSLAGAGTLTNAGNASDTITFGGINTDTTFSGVITDGTGTLNLVKQGTGTTTFSGANGYDGTTTISAGTLVAAGNSALGNTTSGTTVASGATLALEGGFNIGTEALNISGSGAGSNGALRNLSGANTANGAITVTANSTIQSDAGTLTLGGAINGSAASRTLTFTGAGDTTATGNVGANISTVTKTGVGTLTLSGNNTYTGTTAVNAGTLVAGSSTALGAAGGGTTVSNGATLALDNTGTLSESSLTLTGQGVGAQGALLNLAGNNTVSGTIALGGESYVGVASGTTLTSTGVISGSGFGLTKLSDGTLVLTGANTYSGTTAITAGTLEVRNNAGLGSNATPTTIAAGSTLAFNGASLNVSENITLAGSGVGGAGGLQTSGASGTTTLTGAITMNADSVIGTAANTTLRHTGVLGEESGADYNLVKTGAGTLALSGNNTYNGATTVRAGTLLVEGNAPVSADGALGNASSAIIVGDAGSGSSDISLLAGTSAGNVTIARAITVANQGGSVTLGGTNTSNANTFSGPVTLNKDVTLTSAGGGQVNFTGAISGTGAITKTDAGIVLLSGANTYAGATAITAGGLIAAHDNALGSTAAGTTVSSGASLGLQNNITLAAGESISAAGTGLAGLGAIVNVSGNNAIAGPVTLTGNTTVSSLGDTLTFAGAIGQSGGNRSLTTAGAGNLTFTGANTIGGTLTIGGSGTTTLANTSGQAFGSVSQVTVNAGATLALGGANQINDSANLVLNGGTFNVGSFSETMNLLNTSGAGSAINYLDDGSALTFNGSRTLAQLNSATSAGLSIDNWAGSLSGGGTEQLIVRSTTNIAGTTITGINFSDWGTGDNNIAIALGGGLYEIVPLVTGIQWGVNGNGEWNNNGGNWRNSTTGASTAQPNGTNAVAILGDYWNGSAWTGLTTDPTINITGERTVGKLIFENSDDRSYTLSGGGYLDFNVSSGNAQIIVNDNGSHRIAAGTPSYLNDTLVITNNSNAAVGLDIDTGYQFRANGIDLIVNGAGTTRIDGALTRNSTTGNDVIKTGSGTLILEQFK